MRIFARILILTLIFISTTLLFSILVLQTEYAQKKLIKWIEKKSAGSLSIGHLTSFFPFTFSIKELHYKTATLDASFDNIEFSLLPASLLWGRVAVTDLKIGNGRIITQERKWIDPFLPIDLHRLTIYSLSTNEFSNFSIVGKGTLSQNYYFHLNVVDPKRPQFKMNLSVDGDSATKSIYLKSIIESKDQLKLWIKGHYYASSQKFEGSFQGVGPEWSCEAKGEFCKENGLNLSHFKSQIYGHKIDGALNYEFQTHGLNISGSYLDHPFKLHSHLKFNDKDIIAFPLRLDCEHENLNGYLTYLRTEKKFLGELDFEIDQLGDLVFLNQTKDTPCPLDGYAKGHLSLAKDSISFQMQAGQISWKDLFIPQISMGGTWKEGLLTFGIDLPDFTIYDSAYEIFPKVQLQVSGQLNQENLAAHGYIWGLGEKPFYLMCELPIICSPLSHNFDIKRDQPFIVHVQGSGSINPILAFLENASLIAHGKIDLNLTATGSWDAPNLTGHLIYDEGSIESLITGAIFNDIHMEMEGVGSDLKICSLSAHDLQKGELTGCGYITWDPYRHFPFTFQFNTNRYLILALDPFTATVNANILLSGTVEEMRISGHAQLDEGHLAIPNKIPVQIPMIDVHYVNPIATQCMELQGIKSFIPIHWDMTIEAPHHLYIDGRGLESEWRGILKIMGEQNCLRYQGKLYLVQGRFKIINRMFDLVEGQLRIEGLKPKDLFIDLKGDYDLPNLTASVLIMGCIEDINISFCSNPPMNMNQILSWILFQQDINELTPMQACSLASILVSMSGKYTGPKTFDNIKEGLGIDVFSITDCDIDSADVTFQVGKYLSQGTFVGVNKSISGNFDSVLIQTRLIRNFYLEADYGGSLNGVTPSGGKVILKWYKSY